MTAQVDDLKVQVREEVIKNVSLEEVSHTYGFYVNIKGHSLPSSSSSLPSSSSSLPSPPSLF